MSWVYEPAGNIVNYTSGNVSHGYGYGNAHQATQITNTTIPPTTTTNDYYAFNSDGELQGKTVGGVDTYYTWDLQHRLSTVASPSPTGTKVQNLYDADGNRTIAISPTAKVLYLPDHELSLSSAGAFTATRYYTIEGNVVAARTGSGTPNWLLHDHEGSSQLSVNAATLTVSHAYYLPYGALRGVSGPFNTTRGFIDKTFDFSTGLQHLGAREYDPTLGRFISPDPLADLKNPLSLNAYQYGLDSPPSHGDPGGLNACSFDHSECSDSLQAKQDLVGADQQAQITVSGLRDAWINCDIEQSCAPQSLTRTQANQYLDWVTSPSVQADPSLRPLFDEWRHSETPLVEDLFAENIIFSVLTLGAGLAKGLISAGVQGVVRGLGASALSDAVDAVGASGASSAVRNVVYRGLAAGEDPTVGLVARAPGADVSALSHVAGKRLSPWISTSKSLSVASSKYGKNGVIGIDLSRISTEVVDVSHGFPGAPMLSNFARADQEVLIRDFIPAEAIFRP